MRIALLCVALGFGTVGCYHATINTGRPVGSTVITVPWAHSFLAGLVPPSTVEAAAQCSGGVARVETQLSFLNLLANFITLGIYSPMQLDVTCASGSDDLGAAEVVETEAEARAALEEGRAFLIKF